MERLGSSVNPTRISPWIYATTALSVAPFLYLIVATDRISPRSEDQAWVLNGALYHGISRGAVLHTYGLSTDAFAYIALLTVLDSTYLIGKAAISWEHRFRHPKYKYT